MIDEEQLKEMLFEKVMEKNHGRRAYFRELTYGQVCDTINELSSKTEKVTHGN